MHSAIITTIFFFWVQ